MSQHRAWCLHVTADPPLHCMTFGVIPGCLLNASADTSTVSQPQAMQSTLKGVRGEASGEPVQATAVFVEGNDHLLMLQPVLLACSLLTLVCFTGKQQP